MTRKLYFYSENSRGRLQNYREMPKNLFGAIPHRESHDRHKDRFYGNKARFATAYLRKPLKTSEEARFWVSSFFSYLKDNSSATTDKRQNHTTYYPPRRRFRRDIAAYLSPKISCFLSICTIKSAKQNNSFRFLVF